MHRQNFCESFSFLRVNVSQLVRRCQNHLESPQKEDKHNKQAPGWHAMVADNSWSNKEADL